jgi:glycosyltransferase involved in cell wall biosynthesis
MYYDYRDRAPLGSMGRALYSAASHYVRQWDYASAARVDHFAASSENAAKRIRKYYRRDSEVIYPPVDIAAFSLADSCNDFYLVVSPLVAYKRVDLAVAACTQLRRPLVVIGEGPESGRLRRISGPTVKFVGSQPGEVVSEYFRRCRAFLFPGEEDIGLTPIEAQASGRPVIAFGRGGALETVIGASRYSSISSLATGIFFEEQTPRSLADAILHFETFEDRFSPQFIRTHADQFDKRHFVSRMGKFIANKLELHCASAERWEKSLSLAAAHPIF